MSNSCLSRFVPVSGICVPKGKGRIISGAMFSAENELSELLWNYSILTCESLTSRSVSKN